MRIYARENMRKKGLAVLFAVLMALAPTAGVAGAAGATSVGGEQSASSAQQVTDRLSFADGVVQRDAAVEFGEPGQISPSLQDAEGTTTVIVRLGKVDRARLSGLSEQEAVETMKTHAAQTQQNLLRFTGQTDGIEAVERFWILNGVLVEVNTDEVSLEQLSRVEGVERVHPNFDVSLPEPEDSRQTSSDEFSASNDGYETTYGVDQINAPEVWDTFNTQGEGIDVAVLDTGVNPDHPDIEISDDRFVAVDADGNVDESAEAFDNDGHGTHVAGTVAGGNASGEYIGVAPEATMWHAKVLDGTGGGTFAQVAGGMQWAANQSEIEIVSMSLGAGGFSAELIEPQQNLEEAGKILVASAGNSGEGNSGTPGNLYEAIAAGASNENGNIASFSSGQLVDTSEDWGEAAPDDWPSEYYVPDYAAPGVAVKSADYQGGYTELSGTSMSAPHISGAIALMLAVGGENLEQETVEEALSDTAFAPVEDPPQDRYGDGIVDVFNATSQVGLNQSITGTVTGASGESVAGATVTTDQGFETTTNENGEYTVLAETGTAEVTVSGFGIETTSATVEVSENETVTQDFTVDPAFDVTLLSGQPAVIEGGQNTSATAQVANLEAYTAELADGYDEANATLYVNGQQVPFGQTITFDEPTDVTATVTVETAEGTSGNVSVMHTFEGLNQSVEVTTGPTEVFAQFKQVGVVDDNGEFGGAVATTLNEQLPANYAVSVIDSETAIESTGTYDAYVVQNLEEENGEAFTEATVGYDVGTVYLDQWGSDSNGIEVRSEALGDPEETDQSLSGGKPAYAGYPAEHPIFAGVGDGEPIQLHDDTFDDHSWFSGTDATVLADVQAGGEFEGSGVAVSEARWDILGASLGYTTFIEGESYTDEADVILGNMVTVAANPPEPAGTVTATNATLAPGQESASVTVKTDIDGVSGYGITVNFDPEKVQVTDVSGVDTADPVVNLDNEEGTLFMTQAQAEGIDNPEFVEVTFDTTALENGESANVSMSAADSAVYDTNGSAFVVGGYDDGQISVLSAQLGDVDADGEITAGDAVVLQRYLVGLPTQVPADQIEALGDVNQDGQITSADVTLILQIVAGVEEPPQPSENGSESESIDERTVKADPPVRATG